MAVSEKPAATPPEIFRITLEAGPVQTPAIVRLRLALKILGRAFRLRCAHVEQVECANAGDDCRSGSQA